MQGSQRRTRRGDYGFTTYTSEIRTCNVFERIAHASFVTNDHTSKLRMRYTDVGGVCVICTGT